jgi:hypothetical protein
MVRGFALGAMAALSLMGCGSARPPTAAIAVLPTTEQGWAERRRLCTASPQGSHCDVYLRNATPPAPYTTDGVLIQQRRLCVERPSVASCALAQQMGRDAEAEAVRSLASAAAVSPAWGVQAQAADDDDHDAGYPQAPAAVDTSSGVAAQPLPSWRPRRSRMRRIDEGNAVECSDATLAALDLAEPATRAAILRRCRPGRR